ncbi:MULTISPECIES: hypothetical protein [unclassified Flavobacterium]|uniref:hypothetical protein n=1 Tax=unclassified Flavobacterium TaxID=196869 RepID=UPI001EF0353E|nr:MULTISPECIES: hypothetical protein [unclassified Flavobacterium]
MKKTALYLLILIMLISFFPNTISAATGNPSNMPVAEPLEVPAHVQVQLDRLNEIKAMDKSDMTSSEKKALRKEVKVIKSSLRSNNSGIYLSVGAIIIIVLLLILLL